MSSSKILSVGSYLPKKIMTNEDLSKIVNTNDEWIVKRTGITKRHIAEKDESSADMAIKAARIAIKRSGLDVLKLDGVIVATSTPDNLFPSVATKVQYELGMNEGIAFDVNAACAGFVFAVSTAKDMIQSKTVENVLVIGVDMFSKFMDWKDRNTCVLFGDGAGACVVSKTDDNDVSKIIASRIKSDGKYFKELFTYNSPNNYANNSHGIFMNGTEVFKFATDRMVSSVLNILKDNNYSTLDLKLLFPHQANKRIINAVGRYLKLKSDQVVISVDEHANTSAATIPMALNKAYENSILKKGDLMAMTAMGAGFVWGSILFRW